MSVWPKLAMQILIGDTDSKSPSVGDIRISCIWLLGADGQTKTDGRTDSQTDGQDV